MNATKLRSRPWNRAAVAALLAIPALASCSSTNFGAPTDQIYTPTDGANAREGTVYVLHALIISETPGSGRLIAGLVNKADEEDTLTGVRSVDEEQAVEFRLVGGETSIPAEGLLQLATEGSAVVAASADPEALEAGDFVRLAMTFANGEEVTLNVPVLSPGVDYADIEIPEGTSEPTAPDTEG